MAFHQQLHSRLQLIALIISSSFNMEGQDVQGMQICKLTGNQAWILWTEQSHTCRRRRSPPPLHLVRNWEYSRKGCNVQGKKKRSAKTGDGWVCVSSVLWKLLFSSSHSANCCHLSWFQLWLDYSATNRSSWAGETAMCPASLKRGFLCLSEVRPPIGPRCNPINTQSKVRERGLEVVKCGCGMFTEWNKGLKGKGDGVCMRGSVSITHPVF